jgi:hypothetical protein
MNVEINNVVKRARGYWFVDGFTEMIAGGLFVILAAIMLFRGDIFQPAVPSRFLSVMGQISIVKFFGALVAILLLWWLKDHFTYPRTGFVRGNRVTTEQVLMVIRNVVLFLLLPILGLIAASFLFVSAGSVLSSMPIWFPIGVSLIWAVLCVLAGEWMGLRRFRLLGGLILLAGMAIGGWQLASGLPTLPSGIQLAVSQRDVLEIINRAMVSLAELILITGIVLIVSGLVTFLRYRKENPVPYTEAL